MDMQEFFATIGAHYGYSAQEAEELFETLFVLKEPEINVSPASFREMFWINIKRVTIVKSQIMAAYLRATGATTKQTMDGQAQELEQGVTTEENAIAQYVLSQQAE